MKRFFSNCVTKIVKITIMIIIIILIIIITMIVIIVTIAICFCKRHQLRSNQEWHKYKPESVIENSKVK